MTNPNNVTRIKALRAKYSLVSRLVFLPFLVSVSFIAVSLMMLNGKGALPGIVKGGHYFITKGRSTQEVHPFVFWYSRIHGVLFILSVPSIFGVNIWAEILRKQIAVSESKVS